MKILFASDIHGSACYAQKTVDAFIREGADQLVLLGDLLYHGPRNDLPEGHDPKTVISILNSLHDKIICVQGNCDCAVDEMVLKFPIISGYSLLYLDNHRVFISHGHVYNPQNPMPLAKGDVLINGHTHVWKAEETASCIYLNPGSVSLPKEGQANSYMIYQNHTFTIKDLQGTPLKQFIIPSSDISENQKNSKGGFTQ